MNHDVPEAHTGEEASHEAAFVRAFIVANKRSRYLTLLASKRRREFLQRLDHQLDYEPSLARRIPAEQQSNESIEALLCERGASDQCYVISSNDDWDGRTMSLRHALADVVGCGFGTVLSCVPGRLAYWESEDIGERYILHR